MAVYTGTLGEITVSGTVISGSAGTGSECTVVIGRERGKFNKVGTNVSEHTNGMKTVEGTVTRKWISGDTLFQSLIDLADGTEFNVKVEISGQATSITASGCVANTVTRRVAPGTEVMLETMPFVGRDWF